MLRRINLLLICKEKDPKLYDGKTDFFLKRANPKNQKLDHLRKRK